MPQLTEQGVSVFIIGPDTPEAFARYLTRNPLPPWVHVLPDPNGTLLDLFEQPRRRLWGRYGRFPMLWGVDSKARLWPLKASRSPGDLPHWSEALEELISLQHSESDP